MSFSTFCILPPLTPTLPSPPDNRGTNPSAPAFKVWNQDHALTGSSSSAGRSSYEYDLAHGYNLKWGNQSELDAWLRKETESKTIEFVRKEIRRNKDQTTSRQWNERHIYVCGRGFTGGKKVYTKKHTWTRKVPLKHTTGCPCRLTIAYYPHTTMLLGKYNDEHTHELGNQNARFTCLPKDTREEIERLLRLGVEPKKVVCSYLIN